MRKLVHDTLIALEPEIKYSLNAENLVLGTIAQESAYGKYREQLGSGIAKGICQIEPDTFNDIIDNYLEYRPHIWNKIAKISSVLAPKSDDLVLNDRLSICMCRVAYLRQKEPIPNDLYGWARYWKRHYNTMLGKGTEAEFIKNYHRYVIDDEN